MTYDDYTEKTNATFLNTYEFILNDRSDSTDAGYCYITGANFLTWLYANINISTISLTDKSTYEATDYLVGYSATEGNIKVTMPNLVNIIEGNIKQSDITSAAYTEYLATLNFMCFNSADSSNKKMTFADMKTSLESTTGLDLRNMNANSIKILAGGQQAAIADANVSHAVTDFATTNSALDALGGKINAILGALRAIGLVANAP